MRSCIVAFLLLPVVAFTQVDHARTLTKMLCSPEFQGRGYVNGGDSIAAEFIAREFKSAGCKTFKTGPFQSFAFPVNTFPGQMKLAVNNQTLLPGVDYIVDPASGGGTATHQHVYKLPVSAFFDQALLAKELKMLRTQKNAAGKPDYTAVLIYKTGLKGDSLKKAMALSVELTREFAVLQVTDAKFTWSVSDEQYQHPLIEVSQKAFDVSEDEHYIDFAIDAVLQKQHMARNVMAYVPAKHHSKEYIVFTAHYDHLGRMGTATYFPGGNDNASGTAMLLELARYYVQHPLDVNVVFLSFAGEEAGLLGSHYYVQHPVFPLKSIRFLTNLDIMGSGEEGVTVVNATLFPKEFEALQKINEKDHLLVKVASRGPAANSDHYFFTQAGVPAFFIYTMGPNKHYHDVLDTYEELSFSEFGDIFRLLTEFAVSFPKN